MATIRPGALRAQLVPSLRTPGLLLFPRRWQDVYFPEDCSWPKRAWAPRKSRKRRPKVDACTQANRDVFLCAWLNKPLLAQAVPAEAQLPRWRSPSPVVSFTVTIDGAAPTMERGRDRTGCPPTHTSPQIVAPRDAEALRGDDCRGIRATACGRSPVATYLPQLRHRRLSASSSPRSWVHASACHLCFSASCYNARAARVLCGPDLSFAIATIIWQ